MEPIPELVHKAADELRRCASAPNELRTHHLRRVASAFVDIREQCEDPAGRGADYTGRSKEYREAISNAYREVEDDVPPVRLRQMKSQVRYHVSTIIRERLADDPDALELFGLQQKSVRERGQDRIKQRRALEEVGILEQWTEGSNATARLVHGARYLLELAAEEGLDDVDQEARDYIRHGLRLMARVAPNLAPAATRVDLVRDVLQGIESGDVSGFSGAERDDLAAALASIRSEVDRLREAVDGDELPLSDEAVKS